MDHYNDTRRGEQSRRSLSPRSSHKRHRERSPIRRQKRPRVAEEQLTLPFGSRSLSKHDFTIFRSFFSSYLDIQKGKDIDEMSESEAKGRWKSFIGKWFVDSISFKAKLKSARNRRELAEGWYDPTTFQKAQAAMEPAQTSIPSDGRPKNHSLSQARRNQHENSTAAQLVPSDSDSDGSLGPQLPTDQQARNGNDRRPGPSIPNMQDLALKRESEAEDRAMQREDARFERQLDRKGQKAALEELVPRAEAGTRERQLEKKREVNDKMKSFRERSPGAVDVPDAELLGGGDSLDSYKQQKQQMERQKTERELRKEEFLRARQAERDERLQGYKIKEDATMAMLKSLAQQRFGGSS